MSSRAGPATGRTTLSGAFRVAAALLASAGAAGCDDTVQPFLEDGTAIFSMVGYLDLRADTQWVRVMPVRRTLFLGPEPMDAVVTLEHVGDGRTVTLNDSLVAFVDPSLGAVAYAHNFWTTEPLQPEASYRLRAERPDGASTTAVVVMPPDLEILFLENGNDVRLGATFGILHVRAERVLFVHTRHTMGLLHGDPPDTLPTTSVTVGGHSVFETPVPGTHGVAVNGGDLELPGLVDVRRREIRIVAGPPDWPYHAGLPDLAISVPDAVASNVENGVGFVGGVATWTIPFDACEVIEPSPDACTTRFHAGAASLAGVVRQEPCGEPHALVPIQLTERFPGGGAIVRTWKTGWRGEYRFEGIEPGAELLLEVDGAPPVNLPPLAVGERYTVGDIIAQGEC